MNTNVKAKLLELFKRMLDNDWTDGHLFYMEDMDDSVHKYRIKITEDEQ